MNRIHIYSMNTAKDYFWMYEKYNLEDLRGTLDSLMRDEAMTLLPGGVIVLLNERKEATNGEPIGLDTYMLATSIEFSKVILYSSILLYGLDFFSSLL